MTMQHIANAENCSFSILDWDKELIKTNNPIEIIEVLKQLPILARTPNSIVNLVHPINGTLSVGIAGSGDKDNLIIDEPVACINYISESNIPPYLSVIGHASLSKDDKLIIFRYEQGEWTEIPLRNCVSLQKLYDVVDHFVRNGKLPNWIGWEEL